VLRVEFPRGAGVGRRPCPRAVLFDRDGTLIHDVPYLADPDRVRAVQGAAEVLTRLRAQGIAIGVVSNQSGVARGLVHPDQLAAVNLRIEQVLGPFDTWQICPHGPEDGCSCRKPQPSMVLAAARQLGVEPADCVLVGDIGSDVEAALSAGARAVLVPTEATRPEEIARARCAAHVADTLAGAVQDALAGMA
jgi:D-glycero-D-manno-heptose 1,7-bisphosphate phosphatase